MLPLLLVLASIASAQHQGFTPDEAIKQMKLPEGFSARCVASEPMIRQPVSISFDDRGRLWVLQYLQYPNSAGLKPVKQDQYLRTIWDKVPEPPPHGPEGADRITILSDPDEHGVFRKSKDFVTGPEHRHAASASATAASTWSSRRTCSSTRTRTTTTCPTATRKCC